MTRTPAGRWGAPETWSGALLLASKAGDYINGQVVYVMRNPGQLRLRAGENDLK